MSRWARLVVPALVLLAGTGTWDHAPGRAPALLARALAEEPWRAEFDAICGKTQDAMVLPLDQLRDLVARADQLLVELEKLEPSQRKVFTRRLQGCRNLYQFVLESRRPESP